MEDLDLRISNLGSKLSIDSSPDPQNADYLSYLPPKPSNAPSVSSSRSSSLSSTPTATRQSDSTPSKYSRTHGQSLMKSNSSKKSNFVPRKRSVSSSLLPNYTPKYTNTSPTTASNSNRDYQTNPDKQHISISKNNSPIPASRRSGSFSQLFKSSSIATESASARSPLIPSTSLRIVRGLDSKDAHEKRSATTTPIKSGSISSKIFSTSNNNRKPPVSPKPAMSHTNHNTSSETFKHTQTTPKSTPSSSTKPSMFLMASKHRNTGFKTSSPLFKSTSQNSSPNGLPLNTSIDVLNNCTSPTIVSSKKQDLPKQRDRPISKGKTGLTLFQKLKDARDKDLKEKGSDLRRDKVVNSGPVTPIYSSPFVLPPLLSPTLPDWCNAISKMSSFKQSTELTVEKKKSRPAYHSPTTTHDLSSRSPSPHYFDEPKPKKQSFIVSLKLSANVRKQIEKHILGDRTTDAESFQKKATSDPKKRKKSVSESGPTAHKRSKVSRDYSDSESEDEASIQKNVTIKPVTNFKGIRDAHSDNPSDIVGVSTPKLGSPMPLTKNGTSLGTMTNPKKNELASSLEMWHLRPVESSLTAQETRNGTTSTSYALEQRASSSNVLATKSAHWRNLAHDQKRRAEGLRKSGRGDTNDSIIARKKSIAYGIDSVLGYLIAFEYHDQADQVVRRSRQTGHWNSLVKFIDWLIELIQGTEDQGHTDNEKTGKSSKRGDSHNINYHRDEKYGDLYRNMIGLCYQLRAMVYMRISQCYHELMLRVMDSTIYTAITTPSPESSAGAGLFAPGLAGNNNNTNNNNNPNNNNKNNNNTNTHDNRKNNKQSNVSNNHSENDTSYLGEGLDSVELDNSTQRLRDLMTITSKYFKSQAEMIAEFKKGFKELPIESVRLYYPKTWASRNEEDTSVIDGNVKRKNHLHGKNGRGFRPTEDQYILPLHIYSTLQEAAAFSYQILREWCHRQDLEYESILLEGHNAM